MFALLNSSKEKTILNVLLRKRKPNAEKKIYLVYHYCIFRNQWMNLESFPYKTLRSTVNQNFLLRGPAFSMSWFWSKSSDSRCDRDENADFCCLLAKPIGRENKKSKEKISARNGLWSDPIALKIVSDQTNVRLNPPLIIPLPSWSDLWSYHPQTEVISDHTIPRSKRPLIILSPDRSDPWSYHF